MISEKWRYFVRKHGDAPDGVRVPGSVADGYRGLIPEDMIDFWAEKGWGSYAGGILKICDPADLRGVLEVAFRGDADFSAENSAVYAFSAFGRLFGIHATYGTFEIDLLRNEMTAFEYVDRSVTPVPSSDVAASMYGFDPKAADPGDEGGRILFPRAAKKLGPPAADECFAFSPPLLAGGARRLSSLSRGKAVPHFCLLAQLAPVTLVDFGSFPPRKVRTIGR